MTTDIILDETGSGGPPSARFPTEGAAIVVGIVKVADYQQRDFDTGDLEWWDDAHTQPKMGKVVTGLVHSVDGATVLEGDTERPVEVGELVTFWCEKGRWFAYRDAVRNLGSIKVGDVMRWARGTDEEPTKRGMNPRKTWDVAIRHPEPKDGDLPDRCVEQYHALAARPTADTATSSYDDTEEPF